MILRRGKGHVKNQDISHLSNFFLKQSDYKFSKPEREGDPT